MINVVGEIDPVQIGKIGQQLDLDILERAYEGMQVTNEAGDGDEETNQ